MSVSAESITVYIGEPAAGYAGTVLINCLIYDEGCMPWCILGRLGLVFKTCDLSAFVYFRSTCVDMILFQVVR